MRQPKDDLSRSLVAFDQNTTIVAAVELSSRTWLVGGVVPGIVRNPLKKLMPDEQALLKLLYRWRDEAKKAGQKIKRIVVAFEAGRDGFWLARWLRARDIEAYVIHPTSIPVSRNRNVPKPTDWTLASSYALSLVGFAVRRNIAAWRQFRH